MLGFVLDVVFTVVAIRAIWRLLQGIRIGMSVGTAEPRVKERPGPPAQGVQMVKDPVCGTYVVPERALSVHAGRETVYFCSAACRDKFRAKTA
jgi:YHS domain-containing protein